MFMSSTLVVSSAGVVLTGAKLSLVLVLAWLRDDDNDGHTDPLTANALSCAEGQLHWVWRHSQLPAQLRTRPSFLFPSSFSYDTIRLHIPFLHIQLRHRSYRSVI